MCTATVQPIEREITSGCPQPSGLRRAKLVRRRHKGPKAERSRFAQQMRAEPPRKGRDGCSQPSARAARSESSPYPVYVLGAPKARSFLQSGISTTSTASLSTSTRCRKRISRHSPQKYGCWGARTPDTPPSLLSNPKGGTGKGTASDTLPPELLEIIDTWDRLPDQLRIAVLHIVRTVK